VHTPLQGSFQLFFGFVVAMQMHIARLETGLAGNFQLARLTTSTPTAKPARRRAKPREKYALAA
jgi:hypothetical protein